MAVKADAPRTVVGPDHAAARVVIIIGVIIRIIVAADEVTMVVVREAEAAVMKPTMMETAAMEAANMHAAAVPAATAVMETSAVEAATSHMAASHVTATTTMSAAAMSADFDHRCAGRGSCRGRRTWTDQRHRLGATAWRSGEQHHCCRNNAEAADKAAPWIGNPPHA